MEKKSQCFKEQIKTKQTNALKKRKEKKKKRGKIKEKPECIIPKKIFKKNSVLKIT